MGDDQDSTVGVVITETEDNEVSVDLQSAQGYFETLQEDNDYFKLMLDLIPAQGYFDLSTLQKIKSHAESENQKKQVRGTKRVADKPRKAVNPISSKSVTQLQKDLEKYKEHGSDDEVEPVTAVKAKKQRMLEPEHRKSGKNKKEKPQNGRTRIEEDIKKRRGTDSVHSAEVEKTVTALQLNKQTSKEKSVEKKRNAFMKDANSGSEGQQASLTVTTNQLYTTDDKRSILRAKIEALQAKRNMSGVDKAEMRRQRKEKRLQRKAKRKELKQGKGRTGVQSGTPGKPDGKAGQQGKMSSPVYNSEGKMVFSKFDFTPKKKEKNNLSGKDYKRLLEKVEKRNQKIQKLKDKDESAAELLKDKFKWDSVLQKAEGAKVKDNPELLKKALKKKEKLKEKKKKKWSEREAYTQKLMDAKQEKRKKNIQARKKARVDKKIKRAKKKGRMLPGF